MLLIYDNWILQLLPKATKWPSFLQFYTTVQAVCIYRKLKLSIEKVKELEFEAYAYLHGKFDYIYILFLK